MDFFWLNKYCLGILDCLLLGYELSFVGGVVVFGSYVGCWEYCDCFSGGGCGIVVV